MRRRLGPVVGGCSDVDIVSWYLVFEWDVTEVVVWYDCGVLGLWLLVSIFILFPGGRGVVLSMRVVVLVGFLSAATVSFIPNVFVGWVVGLVCGWSGLFEFFASLICASVMGFKPCFFVTFIILNSLGGSWVTFFVANDVFITMIVVEEYSYQ